MKNNYFYAKNLHDKDNLKNVSSHPGYYKWWATETELMSILTKLEISTVNLNEFEVKRFDEEERYCIYVGIEKNLRNRIKWHITQPYAKKNVNNGTLSTLRLSIASLFGENFTDIDATENAINDFINKLIVETFECVYKEAQDKEKEFLEGKYLYVLNIKDNKHQDAPLKKLKEKRSNVRKEIKGLSI